MLKIVIFSSLLIIQSIAFAATEKIIVKADVLSCYLISEEDPEKVCEKTWSDLESELDIELKEMPTGAYVGRLILFRKNDGMTFKYDITISKRSFAVDKNHYWVKAIVTANQGQFDEKARYTVSGSFIKTITGLTFEGSEILTGYANETHSYIPVLSISHPVDFDISLK